MSENITQSGGGVEPPLGVVLAGGPGRRLGGDKPFRLVGGKRLIDLALEKLAQICPKQIIVTNQVAAFADQPCGVVADRWPGQGPLAAVTTVFLDCNPRAILVIPVDTPLISLELLRLVSQAQEDERAVAPQGPRGPEPLMAYYHRSCLPIAQRLLQKDERRLRKLLQVVKARMIPYSQVAALDPEGLSFLNVNFPQELEKVRQLALQKWGV